MSGGGTGQGALYSPLPQSISDTDSSEEELISVVHHNDNRKIVVSGKETIDKKNGQKMGDYHPLDHDTEHDVAINGFPVCQTTADNVSIIKPEGTIPRHLEPMSPLRKIFFLLSIFLCGITIVVFLWVIPCDWATCPSVPLKAGTKAWEKTLTPIELKGRISVVSGVSGRGHNLVFLMRDDIVSGYLGENKPVKETAEMLPPNGGGILSLIGSTGKVAWWKKLKSLPHDIDCSLVDLNNDGVNDCIVVGADKLLIAVDPISGNVVWRLRNKTSDELAVSDIDFPLILPDLDDDGKNELVSVCTVNGSSSNESFSEHNDLILISGSSGIIIGRPLKISNCLRVSKLSLETEDRSISYTCEHVTSSGKDSTISQIYLQELYVKTTQESIWPSSINLMKYKYLSLKQHQEPHSPDTNDGTWSSPYVSGHRLSITRSQCHGHCTVTAKIYDERSDMPNKIVWNFTPKNTYAMVPTPLILSNKSLGAGGNSIFPSTISGFVLKYWQWNPEQKHVVRVRDSSLSTQALFRNRLKRHNSFNDLYLHEINRRFAPSVTLKSKSTKFSNISVHHLSERIVIVIFNGTKPNATHISQNRITQLCLHSDTHDNHQICQPDLRFQEQSMLIADLDQDGSQELISYLTTFKIEDEDDIQSSKLWLQSQVRVIRLETELLKYYENIDFSN